MRSVWRSFIAALEGGTFCLENVRPHDSSLGASLVSLVETLWERLPRSSWPHDPEVRQVENCVTYTVDFGLPNTTPFHFSFTVDGDRWFLSHVETIHIPLEIPQCPTSSFPDLPERTKAFMREETTVTEQMRTFAFLRKEHNLEFALDSLKDGHGYALAARAWVPHLPQRLAFILYVCWEQQRLRGSEVTLVEMTHSSAVVRLKPMFLEVYARASHLRGQVSRDDYLRIFEAIWVDRAASAGWALTVKYERGDPRTGPQDGVDADHEEQWVEFRMRLLQ